MKKTTETYFEAIVWYIIQISIINKKDILMSDKARDENKIHSQ